MNSSKTFKLLTARLLRANAERLWDKAVMANAVGRIAQHRQLLLEQKGSLVSRLRRLQQLSIDDAYVALEGVALLVSFNDAEMSIYLHQLDPDVQDEIFPLVVQLLTASHVRERVSGA